MLKQRISIEERSRLEAQHELTELGNQASEELHTPADVVYHVYFVEDGEEFIFASTISQHNAERMAGLIARLWSGTHSRVERSKVIVSSSITYPWPSRWLLDRDGLRQLPHTMEALTVRILVSTRGDCQCQFCNDKNVPMWEISGRPAVDQRIKRVALLCEDCMRKLYLCINSWFNEPSQESK